MFAAAITLLIASDIEAAQPFDQLPRNLTDRLLTSAGPNAIVYRRAGQSQLIELADPISPDAVMTADMRQRDIGSLIVGALDTLFAGPGRTLRIVGEGDLDESLIEILMPETPLLRAYVDRITGRPAYARAAAKDEG